VRAINAFLHDIYHRQEILRAGIVPVELISRNAAFLPQMIVHPLAAFTPTLLAPTLCAQAKMISLFLKTMHAHLLAFRTCWKTARRYCKYSLNFSARSRFSLSAITPKTCAVRLPPAPLRTPRVSQLLLSLPRNSQLCLFRTFVSCEPSGR
jgi:hypothetical protein